MSTLRNKKLTKEHFASSVAFLKRIIWAPDDDDVEKLAIMLAARDSAVAAAERDACANLCLSVAANPGLPDTVSAGQCVLLIRDRARVAE